MKLIILKIVLIFITLTSKAYSDEVIFGFSGVQIPKQQLRFTIFDESDNKVQELLLDPNPKRNLTTSLHFKKFLTFFRLFPKLHVLSISRVSMPSINMM